MNIKYLVLSIFISVPFLQDPPGIPVIAWLPPEYTLENGGIDITIIWDMWWGENGDHWKLNQNDNIVFEADIASNTPNAQHDEATVTLSYAGSYSFIVFLCKGSDESEECSQSNPAVITVTDPGGGGTGDFGEGTADWGESYFSPFVDATAWPPFSLTAAAQETGVRYFALGFIVDRTGDACEASWGGFFGLDGWTYAHDFMMPLIEDNEIGNLRNMGGDVVVSIGGAANVPLAVACTSVEELKEQIRQVVETYNLTHLDFDIEGIWVLDDEAIQRRSQALTELQDEWENDNRTVKIWYTLPVLPSGLTADGLANIQSAVNHGVELAGINIMAMDYGDGEAPNPEGMMGEYAVQSAQSLHSQLSDIYSNLSNEEIWQMIGVTPMIGMNDVTTEIFDLEDATQLRDFGIQENMKMISMWSANRDQECEEGETGSVSIDCSSILQEPFAFSTIFNTFSNNSQPGFEKNIVGYYTSWATYARDYQVYDIPAQKINFINYAFANINPSSGTVVLGDPYADIDKFHPGDCWDAGCLRGNFHQLQILKENYPQVKTLISVGGWTWSTYFSDIAMTEQSREIFAQSCLDFILEYDFDGVDLDWEYPVEGGLAGNHHHPDDDLHLTLLLQRIRELLDEQGSLSGRQYFLTIAASANPLMMDNLELDIISDYLDWINIMSYDFHGPWGGDGDPVTNFNSPLFAMDADPTPEPYGSQFNLSASVQNYIERGVPREQLQAGLAFYGRAFGNVENVNNGLFASYNGTAGDGTWEDGFFDYWDLEASYVNLNGYNRYWQDEAKVPWLYNPDTQIMISYDDEQSISDKVQYILDENIGGAMFWEFSGDKNGDLLTVVYERFINGDSDQLEGDLNQDGAVNVLDVIMLVNFLLDDQFNPSGDLNGDGSLNVLDVILLVSIILE